MGMKVFFDIITNHTADVIDYQEAHRPAYVSKDREPYRTASGTPFDDRDYAGTQPLPAARARARASRSRRSTRRTPSTSRCPSWLNDVTLYHNRGNTTFTGENSLYGDFFGLDDLFTENPRVVRGMTDIYETWIRDFGIDGFRIDTMKHVNDEFWQRFGPDILAYARAHGKQKFFMFGEVFDTTEVVHVALPDARPGPGGARLPVPEGGAGLRGQLARDRRAARLLRRRRLVHGRRLQRLPAADVPRQPRHGPDRALRRPGQPGRRRRRAAGARPARARADVPLARQPRRLLRRRAGLHRRRRRPGRPPGHVPEPGRLLQRRRPDRHGRDDGAGELRPVASAVPRDRRPGAAHAAPSGAARRRADQPLVLLGARHLRVLARGPPAAARVPRGGEQLGVGADRERPDVHVAHLVRAAVRWRRALGRRAARTSGWA